MKSLNLFLAILAASVIFVANGSAQQEEWSQWTNWETSSTYKGIDFRVRTQHSRWLKKGEYALQLQVRNRYDKDVTLNADLKEPQKKYWGTFGRFTIKTNSTYTSTEKFPTSPFKDLKIRFIHLRFGKGDSGPYAKPDTVGK